MGSCNCKGSCHQTGGCGYYGQELLESGIQLLINKAASEILNWNTVKQNVIKKIKEQPFY